MKVKIAVIQENAAFLDKEAGMRKLDLLCKKYAAQGCQLIIFPESFIPGYIRGPALGGEMGPPTEKGREIFERFYKNSLYFEGEDRERIEQIAKDNHLYIALGATERRSHTASLNCSVAYVSPYNGLMGVHRKLKPTMMERVYWGEGAASDLVTFDTEIGKIGGLICWENYMPLARLAMYQKGVQIYTAITADRAPEWVSTMQHIALEGRCFVIGCNQYFTKDMYPKDIQEMMPDEPDLVCPGRSVVVAPSGEIIAGPLVGELGALVVDIELDEIIKGKMEFDVFGHYSRPDIFDYKANGQPDIWVDRS